jgi:SpoIID/LytB domain protein
MKATRRKSALVLALLLAGLIGMNAITPAQAALTGDVQISGHGWGHGRGMSQWGARGYAVDHNWDTNRILNHYYGGTRHLDIGNPQITVELLSRGGAPLAVTGPGLKVGSTAIGSASVLVERMPNGRFRIHRGDANCANWVLWNGNYGSGAAGNSVALTTVTTADPATHIQICSGGQALGYRGMLRVVNTGSTSMVVNQLPLDDYLKGVVPREMPASWADLGGGKGAQALRAQAVAARSYAWASGRNAYAKTCDTTACQVYAGEYIRNLGSAARTSREDARSNAAIAATTGDVRANGSNQVMRTEFSSSSGGWTAGGTFPAVQDVGDATAGNPNHNWSTAINAGTMAAKLGTPPITGISIPQRNGKGADGGRVLQVVVDTTGGARSFTGSQFRSRLGLKSDWFRVNVRSYAESASYTKALYNDLLGRTPAPSEVSGWANSLAAGADTRSVARSFITSTERLRGTVISVYAGGLQRAPDPRGFNTWVAHLRNGMSFNDFNAAIYGSRESLTKLGGGDLRTWVNGLYQGLLNRTASASERTHWATVAGTRGRGWVVWHISASSEARKKRLNGYYSEMLQRTADPSGLRTWMPLLMQNGDIAVQVFIATSAEYWSKSRTRFP